MIDLINVPSKNDGDQLSAQEFNLVVSGANSAISQLNTLSGSSIEKIIWLSGETKPVIVADTIIGELEEGDTHYITTYTENQNKIAIINNVNKFYPIYKTYSNSDLTLEPYFLLPQNNKFVGFNGRRLFRLSSDLTLDDTFNNTNYNINRFQILSDNSIILCHDDENGDYQILNKLDIDGNIDQTFETITYSGNTQIHWQFSIQSTDKVVAILRDNNNNNNTIIRFNLDGTEDTTFNNYILTGNVTGYTYLYPNSIITTSDDSIICFYYYNVDDNYYYEFVKLNSDGTEDTNFKSNFISTGINVNNSFYSHEQLSNGSFFVSDRNSDYIYKINSDGTTDETFNSNIAQIIDSYINFYINSYVPLIIENDDLVLVIPTSETTSDILRIGADGILISATSIDGWCIIFQSNQSTYAVSKYVYYADADDYDLLYSGLYLYNSNFDRIFTTYIEKPHYAKQSQLENPIFSPNGYYLPTISTYSKNLYVAYPDNFDRAFKVYLYSNDTETFNMIYSGVTLPNILNDTIVILENGGEMGFENLLDLNMNEISGFEIYKQSNYYAPIIIQDIYCAALLSNGTILAYANNDLGRIDFMDSITGNILISITEPYEIFNSEKLRVAKLAAPISGGIGGIGLYKISETKIIFKVGSIIIVGTYDIETETYTPEPFEQVFTLLKNISSNGTEYGVTVEVESSIIAHITFPSGESVNIEQQQIERIPDLPIILESETENYLIRVSEVNGLSIYDYNNDDYTKMIFSFDDTQELLQAISNPLFIPSLTNFNFVKLGSEYHLILNIVSSDPSLQVGLIYKSTDLINWEKVLGGIMRPNDIPNDRYTK